MPSKIVISKILLNSNSEVHLQPSRQTKICNMCKCGFSIAEISRKVSITLSSVRFTVNEYCNNFSGIEPHSTKIAV